MLTDQEILDTLPLETLEPATARDVLKVVRAVVHDHDREIAHLIQRAEHRRSQLRDQTRVDW